MIEKAKSLLEGRFRLAGQLYVGIGGAVLLTLSASLVAWLSFNQIGDATSRVKEESVPEMVASFGVAQYTGILAAAAPRITSAVTKTEFDQVADEIQQTQNLFEQQLLSLSSLSDGTERLDNRGHRLSRIRAYANQLLSNIDEIKSDKKELLVLDAQSAAISIELSLLQQRIEEILVPAIDDQLFYTMTGYSELREPPVPTDEHFSETEFYRYRNVADLHADSNTATQLLASAFTVSDATFIEPLRERAESVRSRIDRSLSVLRGTHYAAALSLIFARLFELSLGDGNGFEILARELELTQRQHELLEQNRDISIQLVAEVDDWVQTAEEHVAVVSDASAQSIWQGRLFLLAISGASIVGAFLITWLFVGKVLLRRIQTLSNRMLRMADGDLETQVEISGRDEVAEMADALEVFRQASIEALELDRVQQLAGELQGKNDELERVLDDLENAQDQIITQGKLAALGELTAGVAHEIRNPLNFINNFSEASGELLDELKEILEEIGDDVDDQQMEYIDEVTEDIAGNMVRIKSHGDRANRIVHGMLAMGRGSTDLQETDVNDLVAESAQLAYHSGRATDPDMNIEIKSELDPDVPSIMAISQDLGRVFINLVNNSWHATEDKRDALREQDPDAAKDYIPGLLITTRLIEDDIEIRFRDNGTGMPQEVVDKIFNPFFTTKATNRGTGLGLSLSMDIISSHGGSIEVETKPGEFTEFIIHLPKENPAASVAAATNS